MLVLSRKVGEQIRIGDGVIIRVMAVAGSRVRLGIEAPQAVSIWREELYAAQVASGDANQPARLPAPVASLAE